MRWFAKLSFGSMLYVAWFVACLGAIALSSLPVAAVFVSPVIFAAVLIGWVHLGEYLGVHDD